MSDLAEGQQRSIIWGVLALVLLVLGSGLVVWHFWGTEQHQDAPAARSYLLDDAADDAAAGTADEESAANLLLAATATPPPTAAPTEEATVVVYISGAVMYPNVYEVRQTARITDVVNAAGGFTPDAASEQINLAARVQDALHIHVPRIGETPQPASTTETGPAAQPASTAPAVININTATAAELETLPGIGEALARRIVDYRATNGPFAAVEDIQNVRGIGAALFAELRGSITVE